MSLIRADLAGAAAADDADPTTAAGMQLAAARRGHRITAPDRAPAALSRELGDFLVELAIALHKHAIYPVGHPLLDGAVDAVARTLLGLLAEYAVLSIGVARRQLVIEGVATDPNHPLLNELRSLPSPPRRRGQSSGVRGSWPTFWRRSRSTRGEMAPRSGRPDSLPTRWKRIHAFPLIDRLELSTAKTDTVEGQIAAGAPRSSGSVSPPRRSRLRPCMAAMDSGTPLERWPSPCDRRHEHERARPGHRRLHANRQRADRAARHSARRGFG
jgi:hypothetical protein